MSRSAFLAGLLTSLVVAVGLLCAGCRDDPAPRPAPAVLSTPLGEVDTSSYVVARDDFCARLDDATAAGVLGSAVTAREAATPGDRIRAGGSKDVVDEHYCSVEAGGTTASAWVFAPPVTRERARALAGAARRRAGCERVDAPAFGAPGVATACRDGVRLAGLFGDAWLTCTLDLGTAAPEREYVDRAGRWCVAVLTAARA